ncbi:MAG: heme peroxidase, partial [Chloroflexi bacterium]|nr:heme peroxidase [Chloroflexota bacterium]
MKTNFFNKLLTNAYGKTKLGLRTSLFLVVLLSILMSSVGVNATQVSAAPVGQGFTVTPADLAFILKQIKIAEYHVANTTSLTGPCGALLGTGPDQIPSPLLSFGLRTVDGTCNNLIPGQENFGAVDQTFPRLTTPEFRSAEDVLPGFGAPGQTTYEQTSGLVFDSEPRTISNLIVDQTSTNPAAVAAAGFPVRTQGNEGVVPCDVNNLPLGCVPQYETLFIPNVTTDVGLSPPFNGLFTIFGQFFDHGLDKITNGGNGAVFVPLKADDPLIAGPDHILGNSDDLPPNQQFMVVTRGHIVTGADGFRNSPNTDTPFVDQSQTYTSHSSHQVFLREYVNNTAGFPVSTGKFLSSIDGGLASWAMIKNQAATLLGLQLVDSNVGNIPMIAADAYGKFIPGPLRGLPQYVTASGLVEGDTANPVLVPADAFFIDTAFLNDIAHSAAPTAGGPDTDTVAGGSLDTTVPAGSYDNELLDLHFICGDGRCNENIALSAVHQVFHSEHDRLIDYIENVLLNDTSGITSLADWQDALGANGWNGERLFQAARFVTEMEYQHLVFEEFARKVQPGINPFQIFAFNQTDIDPAITAEFAHAVYRFGHSMLTDDIARINADGTRNDITLFEGFLNPAEYYDGGTAGPLTSQEAAGSIFMGMSDQVGNEIDEFVTDVLRNKLVGLPLDLAAINITRARSEGVPSLNNFRKQVFAATNDGQLAPYTDWVDFGLVLKHPESLVNFVAAYGKHPSIIAETTIEGKREAARIIVNPDVLDVPPADAADFMFSTGDWANIGDVSITGIDDIDLWMGGLAERTNLFGGLLGSTFNYVFESQLTDLQNGDRFYYLARTLGMNLRDQLEGNSFSELVMRNTNAHTLKADPFATADCKFELERLTFPAAPGSFITGVGSVNDDPLSECNENRLLIQMSNGTIRYRTTNSVDPAGINGQAVYNGKAGVVVDRIWGGVDNDTFWGGEGNDIIEGNDGSDIALGGEGNDIITDSHGDDVHKGGPGNDAIDAGPGLDIIMGGEGNDFMNGGDNDNELLGGGGNDFGFTGMGSDAFVGDAGDDWAQGGPMLDLLIGDSSTFFFDDHNLPGNDVLIGQGGDDDYDAEGGDDIMVAGPGLEKNAGAAGYDWTIGLGENAPQNFDLSLIILAASPPLVEVRDRFNEVEALSGWNYDDILRGDSIIPSDVGAGGFIGCDVLDAAGVARINGLNSLVPASLLTLDSAPIIAASATHFCTISGLVWGDGNILLGGSGSDLIEGRGANDIIDGDKYLNVRLSIRDSFGVEIGSTDLLEHQALTGNFGPGTTGKTLQQAVFAGLVDPGNIFIVREILSNPNPGDVDTAVFNGASTDYLITANLDGSLTVNHIGAVGGGGGGGGISDGIDTLWNIEQLAFSDGTFAAPASVCKTLALGHTGSGSNPIATPGNSAGCPAGLYLEGESISLSGAAASAGWQIGSWTGTSNDASTAATNSFTMPAGNHSVSVNYLDAAPTVVSINRLNATPNTLGSVNFSVTFSESVTGVDKFDFSLITDGTLSGLSITSVSGLGSIRTVAVNTGTGTGTLRLDLTDNDTVKDAATNRLGGTGAGNGNFTTGQSYTIDRTPPVVTSITRASANPSTASVVNFTVAFSKSVTGVDSTDFTVTTDGTLTGASVASIGGTGSTRTVTVNTGIGVGNLDLDLIDNDSIQDAVGNRLGGTGAANGNFTTGETYSVDNNPPLVVSIVRASTNPSNANTVNFTVTFSKPVTGVDGSDFSVLNAGTTMT